MSGAWSNDQLNALFIYDATGDLILTVTENGLIFTAPNRVFTMNTAGFYVEPEPDDGAFLQLTTASGFGGVMFLQPIDSNVPGVTFDSGELYASRDEVLVGPTHTRPFVKLRSPNVEPALHTSQVICRGQDSASSNDDSYVEIVGTLAYHHLYDQRTSDAAAITSTTLVAVNSVTIDVPGTYSFDGLWGLTSTGAAGRPAFALGGTATASAWRWFSGTTHYNTAIGSQGFNASGTTFPGSTSGTNLVNSDWTTTGGFSYTHIKGTVTITDPGTLTFRFATSGAVGQNINIKQGSMVTVELIDF